MKVLEYVEMRVLTSDDAYNKEKVMSKVIDLWCDPNRQNV